MAVKIPENTLPIRNVLSDDYVRVVGQDGKSYRAPKSGFAGDITIDDELSTTSENPVQNKVITGALNEKADIIITSASGSIAHIEDAGAYPVVDLKVGIEPVQDLHGYEYPWPAGGGKNLLNATARDATTSNNITSQVYSDNRVTISGTASANNADCVIECTPIVLTSGQTVTVSWTGTDTRSEIIYVYLGAGSSYTAQQNVSASSNSATFTLAADKTVDRILMRSNNGASVTFDCKVQLELGSSATSWVPYENISPITGWTGANVHDTGINAWDEEWELGQYNNSTGAPYTANDCIRTKNYISVKPNTSYYTVATTGTLQVFYYKADKTYISQKWSTGVITTPANCGYIRFRMASSYGTTYNNDISINYPSTDHDYHAYTGRVIPITWQSEAGTVYGGYDKPFTGKLNVALAIVKFDGSNDEQWDHYSINSGANELFRTTVSDRVSENIYSTSPNISKYKCNSYKPAPNMTTGRTSGTYCGSVTTVDFINDNYSDVTSWRAYLAQNPIQLVYPLATPIEYTITPLQAFELLKGVNNVWSDTGDTDISYKADTKLYIDNKITTAIANAMNS